MPADIMRVGRRSDHDRGDLRIGEHRVGIGNLRAVLRGKPFGRGAVHVDDVLERRARLLRDIARVDRADPAGAEECDIGHLLSIHSCAGSLRKCHSRRGPAITLR